MKGTRKFKEIRYLQSELISRGICNLLEWNLDIKKEFIPWFPVVLGPYDGFESQQPLI